MINMHVSVTTGAMIYVFIAEARLTGRMWKAVLFLIIQTSFQTNGIHVQHLVTAF